MKCKMKRKHPIVSTLNILMADKNAINTNVGVLRNSFLIDINKETIFPIVPVEHNAIVIIIIILSIISKIFLDIFKF